LSLPVIWQPEASEDLIEIAGFIAEHDVRAALGLVHRIELAAMSLADQPYMAPAGRVPGTRELVVHPNYLLIYQVTTSAVVILGVLHARQQYP
jgi:toxin ParE1/3/4